MFDAVTRDWEDADGWIDRGLAALAERPWTNLILHDIVGYPDGAIVHAMRHPRPLPRPGRGTGS